MQVTELEYAGFWIRLGASLIDTVLVMAICFPLLIWIYGWNYLGNEGFIAGPADFLISWAGPTIATILFWRYRQATPGKMMLSLRIVDAETGNAPSLAQSVGRYFGYFLSAIVFCFGFYWIAFDRRKQGWHDKLAGTVVVRPNLRGAEPVRFDV